MPAAGGADRRSAKNAAAPLPEGGHARTWLRTRWLLLAVADFTRLGAVLAAGRAGRGRASGLQYPGLGVVTREVVDAADWWQAAEGGVGTVMVVPVDPGLQGPVAGGI